MKRWWPIAIIVVFLLIVGGYWMLSSKVKSVPMQTQLPIKTSVTPTILPTATPATTTKKWRGTWTNSLGENGNDTLEITTDTAGNFKGVWSGNINVTGQWLTKATLKMSGKTTTRDYQVTGTIQDSTLFLSYTATRLNSSGTYTGEEKLTLSP